MIEDILVVDAVSHAYNQSPENYQADPDLCREFAEMGYHGLHLGFQPRGETKWILDEERFYNGMDPEMIGHAFFSESPTDIAVYHSIPLYGLFKDGLSPLWVGKEMRDRYEGRVYLYAGISPFEDGVLDKVDQLVEEQGVLALKVYPGDIIDGVFHDWRLDDPEIAFPIIERAQSHGLRTIAVHKSQPLGAVPIGPFNVGDLERAAMAFPDMNFEIVHGGWAFLEETASLVARFKNVYVNLEATSAYLHKAPMIFSTIVGAFLAAGGVDRLLWATGAMLYHPRPYVEAFWDWQMPESLQDGYGYPALSREDKAGILGGNFARMHGLSVEKLKSRIVDGRFPKPEEFAEPWSGGRRAVGA